MGYEPTRSPGDAILAHGTYKSTCRLGDRSDHGHLGTMKSCFPGTRKSTRLVYQRLAGSPQLPRWTGRPRLDMGCQRLAECCPPTVVTCLGHYGCQCPLPSLAPDHLVKPRQGGGTSCNTGIAGPRAPQLHRPSLSHQGVLSVGDPESGVHLASQPLKIVATGQRDGSVSKGTSCPA